MRPLRPAEPGFAGTSIFRRRSGRITGPSRASVSNFAKHSYQAFDRREWTIRLPIPSLFCRASPVHSFSGPSRPDPVKGPNR